MSSKFGLNYFEYNLFPLQVMLLHCIEQNQGEGGVSEIVDGFHVAELLKAADIEAFNLL